MSLHRHVVFFCVYPTYVNVTNTNTCKVPQMRCNFTLRLRGEISKFISLINIRVTSCVKRLRCLRLLAASGTAPTGLQGSVKRDDFVLIYPCVSVLVLHIQVCKNTCIK